MRSKSTASVRMCIPMQEICRTKLGMNCMLPQKSGMLAHSSKLQGEGGASAAGRRSREQGQETRAERSGAAKRIKNIE